MCEMLGYEVLQEKKIKTFLLRGILFELKKMSVTYIFSLFLPLSSLPSLPLSSPKYQHPAMYLARWLSFLGT